MFLQYCPPPPSPHHHPQHNIQLSFPHHNQRHHYPGCHFVNGCFGRWTPIGLFHEACLHASPIFIQSTASSSFVIYLFICLFIYIVLLFIYLSIPCLPSCPWLFPAHFIQSILSSSFLFTCNLFI